jgi:Rrf2 family protein
MEIAQLAEDERIATAAVAARQQIPLPFLAKIVSQLVVRGILDATRGASGGVKLARDPATVTMREIIEAIDGPISLNLCARDISACELSLTCALCEVFAETQQELVSKLDAITLADLALRAEAINAEA